MATIKKNGVTVISTAGNAVYDVFIVLGVPNEEENGEPVYHEELRGMGSDEEYVLNQYI